ncbi:MAG: GSCFA domain-containing protein [Alistipes sp.]|nr:GSCFA domain-containing protein [Alistipes sp.]
MKFRTAIEIEPLPHSIDYGSRILSIGSCFAENISRRLAQDKFRAELSPSGIVFNPASIAAAIEMFASHRRISPDELLPVGDIWVHHDFHSSLSSTDRRQAVQTMQRAVDRGAELIGRADWIIITLGTAWVYRLRATGRIVANCHKRPAADFSREMLDCDTIAEILDNLAEGALSGKNIILTVSPVRHLGDGLQQNSLSKATLRIAAQRCVDRHENVFYFPSFEILNDDLRDYRFYADDMAHPSSAAVDYIWERFAEAVISPQARQIMPRIRSVATAAAHRPMNPSSAVYKDFCRRQLQTIDSMPAIDFDKEKRYFLSMLEIN